MADQRQYMPRRQCMQVLDCVKCDMPGHVLGMIVRLYKCRSIC